MDTNEAVFYLVAVGLGAFAGLGRVLRDNSYSGVGHLVGTTICAGLFSFGVCTCLVFFIPSVGGNRPAILGLATLLGLGGKELNDIVLKRILGKFGLIGDKKDEP